MVNVIKNKVTVNGKIKGMGYLKSLNSHRDYSINNQEVTPILKKVNLVSASRPSPNSRHKIKVVKPLPKKVDFRSKMSQIRDQDELGACTAFAASAIVEYFLQKAYNKKNASISTRFTYKTTRNLMRKEGEGDSGAYLRTVMGSIALFGSPPEDYWEYSVKKFDDEPTAFCYAFASNYQGIKYVRIDQPNMSTNAIIEMMKRFLAKELPVMFGFTCFESIDKAATNGGIIPYPDSQEDIVGGHAVTMCGYDDKTSLFLFKNSWGTDWGDDGYGYIPYKYFEERLADDCWVILNQEWIDQIQFQD